MALAFGVSCGATAVFDLMEAIIIGVIFSSVVFIVKISKVDISISDIDKDKLNDQIKYNIDLEYVKVIYLTGPVFFATVERLKSELLSIENANTIIL